MLKNAVAETSQSAVARATGLTLQTVQRYIKGIGEPTTSTLQKLGAYFRVPAGWLRGDYPDLSFDDAVDLYEYLRKPEEYLYEHSAIGLEIGKLTTGLDIDGLKVVRDLMSLLQDMRRGIYGVESEKQQSEKESEVIDRLMKLFWEIHRNGNKPP